jgi:acetyl/propionyl-CoA carboxylase alpha subunit
VTEMITGIDLVEWQIRLAQGEKLAFSQQDLKIQGHAFECRLYAENPDADFLPTTGKLVQQHHLSLNNPAHLRFEAGMKIGQEVTTNFDPMLAKVVTWGITRQHAREQMLKALGQSLMAGVKTNRSYLSRLLNHDLVIKGELSTHLIVDQKESLKMTLSEEKILKIAGDFLLSFKERFFHGRSKETLQFSIEGEDFSLEAHGHGERMVLNYQGQLLEINSQSTTDTTTSATCILLASSPSMESSVHIFYFNDSIVEDYLVSLRKKVTRQSSVYSSLEGLTSPLPGKIFKVIKDEGSKVTQGEVVVIVEAMKMEHTICANKDGLVANMAVSTGEQVQAGDFLFEII